MNDDTVIGRTECRACGDNPETRFSDLDERHRRLFGDLVDNAQSGAFERAVDRIAELEDENKRLREGLSSICDTDTPHTIDRYTRRIAELEAEVKYEAQAATVEAERHDHYREKCKELEARLAEAEAALEEIAHGHMLTNDQKHAIACEALGIKRDVKK